MHDHSEMIKQAYFVTGTDTGVGKTRVSAALISAFKAHDHRVLGMKPIAAGTVLVDEKYQNEDVIMLSDAANVSAPADLINPYLFDPPIAPHIAAAQAGVSISLETIQAAFIQLQSLAEVVIVEGAGGFLVPLDDQQDMGDLAKCLQLPMILVVGMRLGCLNHALLTVEAIQSRGLTLAGWVANHIDPDMLCVEENLASLRQRIPAPCLGVLPWQVEAQLDAVAKQIKLPIFQPPV